MSSERRTTYRAGYQDDDISVKDSLADAAQTGDASKLAEALKDEFEAVIERIGIKGNPSYKPGI